MKPRHLVLGAALACAVLLVIFGDKSPDGQIAEAVERTPGPRPAPSVSAAAASAAATAAAGERVPASAATAAGRAAILALVPRETLIGDGDTQFRQDGQGVFARQDWTPPPPRPQPAPPPPPPSAPPLPFTFIGKSLDEGAWEIYLARGDRTYVVRDKTVIDGTWRVDAIAPPILTLTYLPLNQVQQLNIGVFD